MDRLARLGQLVVISTSATGQFDRLAAEHRLEAALAAAAARREREAQGAE